MRSDPLSIALVVLAVTGCRTETRGELSRQQCDEMVRQETRLRAPGAEEAEERRVEPAIASCMKRTTERTYACVMRATSAEDLNACALPE